MFLATLVVEQGFFRSALAYGFRSDGYVAVFAVIAVEHSHFQRGQRAARVAVSEIRNHFHRLVFHIHDGSSETALVFESVPQKRG